MQNKWKSFFSDNAAKEANRYGVPITVGSSDFTYPILAIEVYNSIILACIISVAGFFGLLWLFTYSDFALILLGTLSMILILVVVLCVHLVFFSNVVDLLDIVVLVAVISMMVDFPVHVILFYQNAREKEKKDKQIDFSSGETTSAKAISIPVSSTSQYMRFALLGPVILSILSAIPLLFASLQILRKTGQYIIILSATSYVFSVVLMPFLLGLSCSTKFCSYFFNNQSSDRNRESVVIRSLHLPTEVIEDNNNNSYSSQEIIRPEVNIVNNVNSVYDEDTNIDNEISAQYNNNLDSNIYNDRSNNNNNVDVDSNAIISIDDIRITI